MRYIDADKLIDKIFPIGLIDDGNYTINAKAVKIAIDKMPTADVVPKSEVDRLELTLQGVMWSVDKWLDEADYNADPVKRAITMREKTLRIIEELALKNHQLKEENEYLQSVVDGLDDFVLQVKQEFARAIFEEIENFITNECLTAKDSRDIEGYVKSSVHYGIAELKKKYTESEDTP